MKRFIIISIALIINWLGCKPNQPTTQLQPALQLANPRIAPWQRVPERLTFENLTVDNGLSSNSITKLFMDKKGYLWVGTDNGLNRYDGQGFKVFKSDKKNPEHSLLDNAIIDIQQDSKGNLWVLSPKGLNEITQEGQIRAYLTDTYFTQHISTNRFSMFLDKQDRLWFCQLNLKFDLATKKLDTLKFTSSDTSAFAPRLARFQTDSKGQIWAITWGSNFICRLDESTQSFHKIKELSGFDDYTIVVDKADNLWVGGQGGNLGCFNTNTLESKLYRSNPNASKLKSLGGTINNIYYAKEQDALFLAAFGGVIRMDLNPTTQDTFQRYTRNVKDPFSLTDQVVHDVLVDKSGNLWVGTSSAGLCKYSPTKQKFESFSTIGDSSSLASRQIETLLFDNQNQLWVGTDRGLNLLTNRQQGLFKTFSQTILPNTHNNFNAFKYLSLDTVESALYCSFWGHFPEKFNLKNRRFEPLIAKNLPNQRLTGNGMAYFHNQHIKLQDGRVVYGVFGGVLRIYDPKIQQFYHIDPATKHKQQWLSELISNVFQDKSGIVWLANSEGKGLTKMDFSKGDMLNNAFFDKQKQNWIPDTIHSFGTFTNFKPNDKDSTQLQNGFITTFFEDSSARLWLGTANGLYWMQDRDNKGVFKRYDETHGFKSTAISAIQEDKYGQFWISTTDAGIAVFDPKQEKVLKTFTKEDGLVSNQFNANVSAKSASGLMAFGSSKGLNLFHPDSLCGNLVVPSLEILKIEANGIEKKLADNLVELPHNSNPIIITPRIMDFSSPNTNKISYMLVGIDKDFSEPRIANTISCPSLLSGSYTLRVKCANNDGVWNNPISLKINIKFSFWESGWGICIIIIIMILSGLFIIIFYLKHIEKVKQKIETDMEAKQTENTKALASLEARALLAQLNPHFVHGVLTMVQAQIIAQEPQKASQTIVELSHLIRNFFDSSASNYGNRNNIKLVDISLQKEYNLLEQYLKFEQMKYADKFDFSIVWDNNIHWGIYRIPPLFLQPYVENAVLHGALSRKDDIKGSVLVQFSKIEDDDDTKDTIIVCTIEDNGIGIQQSKALKNLKIGKQHHSMGMELLSIRKEKLNALGYEIRVDIQEANPEDNAYPGTRITIQIML